MVMTATMTRFVTTSVAMPSIAALELSSALDDLSVSRAGVSALVPLLTAGKLALDAAGSGWLTVEQVSKHHALCFYCGTASAATLAALPLALPEARAAWRRLRG